MERSKRGDKVGHTQFARESALANFQTDPSAVTTEPANRRTGVAGLEIVVGRTRLQENNCAPKSRCFQLYKSVAPSDQETKCALIVPIPSMPIMHSPNAGMLHTERIDARPDWPALLADCRAEPCWRGTEGN